MFSFLARLGSRPYFFAGLLTSLVLFGRGCANEVACGDADCGDGGAGAGSEGGGDPGFSCGGKVCAEVLAGNCIAVYQCDEQDRCLGLEITEGKDDKNKCTFDVCEDDVWRHIPFTAEEMDDGDPCTIDECDAASGIVHTQQC